MTDLKDPIEQLKNSANLKKYKDAGNIAASAMEYVIRETIVGRNICEICEISDKNILKEISMVYPEIDYKGIAYPTCISVNNTVCNFRGNRILCDGDLAKIELGVHIDGYHTEVCHSVLIGIGDNKDAKMRIFKALKHCSGEIFKNMKPGGSNLEIADIMKKISQKYGCNLPYSLDTQDAPSTISYQISRNNYDGYTYDDSKYPHQLILCRQSPAFDLKMKESLFEENEIYSIDITMISGRGQIQNAGVNIYRRNHEKISPLRLKSSRILLNELDGYFPKLLNTDNKNYKLGVKECLGKDLIIAYPVMESKPGELVGRLKFTVVVKPDPLLISGRKVDDELKKLD